MGVGLGHQTGCVMRNLVLGIVLSATIAVLVVFLLVEVGAESEAMLCPPIGVCGVGERSGIPGTELVERYEDHGEGTIRVFQSEPGVGEVFLYLLREVPTDCKSWDYTVHVGDTVRIEGHRAPVSAMACAQAPAFLIEKRSVPRDAGPAYIRWELDGLVIRDEVHRIR